MRSCALFTAVVCAALVAFTSKPSIASPQPKLADGTLLFLENCNSVVEWSTRGRIAHVAIVFNMADEAWVYEATPAAVRQVKLADYDVELARLNQRRSADKRVKLIALAPLRGYSAEETARMKKYLDEQVGRRYSVKSYLRRKPADGIHCAELASTTLNQSQRYAFVDCHKIHPQGLYDAVLSTHEEPRELAASKIEEKEQWTVRFGRCWTGWWSWCGWSCREAWLFL